MTEKERMTWKIYLFARHVCAPKIPRLLSRFITRENRVLDLGIWEFVVRNKIKSCRFPVAET